MFGKEYFAKRGKLNKRWTVEDAAAFVLLSFMVLVAIGGVLAVGYAILNPGDGRRATNAPIVFHLIGAESDRHGTFDYNSGAIIGVCDAERCYPIGQVAYYRYE